MSALENHLSIPVLAQGGAPEPCECAIGTVDFQAALVAAGWGEGQRFGDLVETVLCERHGHPDPCYYGRHAPEDCPAALERPAEDVDDLT